MERVVQSSSARPGPGRSPGAWDALWAARTAKKPTSSFWAESGSEQTMSCDLDQPGSQLRPQSQDPMGTKQVGKGASSSPSPLAFAGKRPAARAALTQTLQN